MGKIDVRIGVREESRYWQKLRQKRHMLPQKSASSVEGSSSIAKKPMDLELYKATIKGDVENFIATLDRVSNEKKISPPSIFDQSSPLQNSYLHVAATFGHESLAGSMADNFPSLLISRNAKGDTPLHVAVREGHLSVARVLIRYAADTPSCSSAFVDGVRAIDNDCPDILLSSTNKDGNTALHEAILSDHKAAVECLMMMDIGGVCSCTLNKEGKTAFYLAVESGKVDIVQLMLRSFELPGRSFEEMKIGKSVLHASIRAKTKDLVEILLDRLPTLIELRDEGGETPLHCAASTGYDDIVQYLLSKFGDLVLESDDNGFLPIHIASRKGHLDIVQMLLHHWPDWRELLTKQGENILHVAAQSGKRNVVNHLLTNLEHEKLVNARDDNGNTALHLAARHWHPQVVSCLTWDKRVKLELVNDDGMTTLDVAEEHMGMSASFRKRLTWMALKSAGTPHGKCSKVPKRNAETSLKRQERNMENYKDRINTLLLVATLVATVTYAAGFTMPGGYNNSDPNQGIATMLNKSKFQIFVICDTIAMYSSMVVAVSLIWAQLGDLNLILTSLRLALPLLGLALSMMSLAFMAGVYLVVGAHSWLGNVVLIMGIVFLSILLVLFIPLFFPNTSNCRVLRHISYYFFCLMMLASGSYREDEEE